MRILLTILILLTGHNGFAGNEVDTIKVFFKMGSPVLSKTAMQYLDSLSYYNILDTRKTYLVIGYADMIGNDSSNRKLSAQRAYTVAEYLKGLGIKSIDTIVGAGEVAKPEKPDGYPDDRRVDIVLLKSKLTGKTAVKIDISAMSKNGVVDLENIFFVPGLAIILETSYPALNLLLDQLIKNPKIKIQIEGHVHCSLVGSSSYTPIHTEYVERFRETEFQLSRDRAIAIYSYLAKNGIKTYRMKYKGLGCAGMETHPENNRRVAIRILDK